MIIFNYRQLDEQILFLVLFLKDQSFKKCDNVMQLNTIPHQGFELPLYLKIQFVLLSWSVSSIV